LHNPKGNFYFPSTSTQILDQINFCQIVNMARPHLRWSGANGKHIVFIKDVPMELTAEVTKILATRYDPTDIENYFPHGKTTTLAVSFPTAERAGEVQREADAMRVQYAILRAETDNRPRRPVRAPQPQMRIFNLNHKYREEVTNKAETLATVPEHVPILKKTQPGTYGESTWAQVAGKDNGMGKTPLPALGAAFQKREIATAKPTPEIKTNAPRFVTDPAGFGLASTGSMDFPPLNIPAFNKTVGFKGHVEDNHKTDQAHATAADTTGFKDNHKTDQMQATAAVMTVMEPLVKGNHEVKEVQQTTAKVEPYVFNSIFPAWHTSNSTETIRRRHQLNCVFCKKRMGSWAPDRPYN
jgi:hypothetical protein